MAGLPRADPPEKPIPSPQDSLFTFFDTSKKDYEEDYHVFNRREKFFLVLLVALAGTFSPLSNNIYLPALHEIALDTEASPQTVSLTVTTFMIAQGLVPSFWGPLADCIGRRQIIIYTLILFVGSNVGLGLTRDIGVMMFLRFVQATGCASMGSIGAGIIADIAPAKDRGGYLGMFSGMRQVSLAIGPVFGGILAEALGYHSIFWTLVILSGIVLAATIVLLPETLRSIAGNGSLPLKGWKFAPLYHKSAPWVKAEAAGMNQSVSGDTAQVREKVTLRMFLEPVKFLIEPDVACTLFFGAVIFTVWSMVTASTTSILVREYQLSTLQVGLCFLPNGLGCAMGSVIAGNQMDRDFRLAEDSYKYEHDLPRSHQLPKSDMPVDFPVERARLAQLPNQTAIFVFSVVVYGFSVTSDEFTKRLGESLVVPLMAQFAIGFSSTAVLNVNNMLTVDLYPGKSATATAVNNLARYMVGAVGVSLTEVWLEVSAPMVVFSVLGAIVVLVYPMVWAEWEYGGMWRARRTERLRLREEQNMTKA